MVQLLLLMFSRPPTKKNAPEARVGRPSFAPTGAAPKSVLPPPAVQGTVKGFYLRALLRELADHGHHLTNSGSYREFADYPRAVAHDLLLECAQRLYPHERRGEAMRRVGWIVYPTLLSTMVGKVIFASLGDDVCAVLRQGGRGFDVSMSEGRYTPVVVAPGQARIEVRDFPLFPESFLVGVFEGLLAHYKRDDAKVVAHVLNARDVDFDLTW